MGLKLEEFDAYQKAYEFWRSVTAILERPAFRRERNLRAQIGDANDSIIANFAEGFEQPTDRAFANYLFHSKGSAAEVVARLREAHVKNCIGKDDLDRHVALGNEVCRLLAGLARYLDQSNFKDRGRYKQKAAGSPRPAPAIARRNPSARTEPRTRDEGPGTKDGRRTRDEGRGTKD